MQEGLEVSLHYADSVSVRLLKDGELLSKFSFAPLDESQQFKQFNRFGEKLNGLTAASFKPDE